MALLNSLRYLVRGDSMAPAFERGQHVLARRAGGAPLALARGDVVIVREPRDDLKSYLKRVVGLPGERVRLTDGLLYVAEARLEEPYLGGLPSSVGLGDSDWHLEDDEYVVLGDNRAHSTDSREFGPVKQRDIVGKVWFRYWPPRSWGRIGQA